MDPLQVEKFRTILMEELDRLLAQASISRYELASEDHQAIEYLDKATVQADRAMRLRIRTRESRLIKKLRLALDRIETGTYGECDLCGEDISLKRLEAPARNHQMY